MAIEHNMDAFCKGLLKETTETSLDVISVTMGDEKFLPAEGSQEIPGFRCSMITVSRHLDEWYLGTSLDDASILHIIAKMDGVVHLASLVDGPDCERIIAVRV